MKHISKINNSSGILKIKVSADTFKVIEESKVLNNFIIMRVICLLNYLINRKLYG